jgi:hypothetical protein
MNRAFVLDDTALLEGHMNAPPALADFYNKPLAVENEAHVSMFFRLSLNKNLGCMLDEQGHPTRQASALPIRGSRSI